MFHLTCFIPLLSNCSRPIKLIVTTWLRFVHNFPAVNSCIECRVLTAKQSRGRPVPRSAAPSHHPQSRLRLLQSLIYPISSQLQVGCMEGGGPRRCGQEEARCGGSRQPPASPTQLCLLAAFSGGKMGKTRVKEGGRRRCQNKSGGIFTSNLLQAPRWPHISGCLTLQRCAAKYLKALIY